ncbi:hypothetical protein CBR_g26463 [Chara braunii]|uniref:YbaK/aminoacyl-tRNA synthetase-associated domain-containing protein n=1 Tax=Chara braunii TaxID=69332 RepID=A0A388L835_CHABU|nr:hypothetical protein CBR_g26463 [Chara braunii]|eukprot:GBG78434.1 hypothetical protein CBR_g26463 [Chara braunii]
MDSCRSSDDRCLGPAEGIGGVEMKEAEILAKQQEAISEKIERLTSKLESFMLQPQSCARCEELSVRQTEILRRIDDIEARLLQKLGVRGDTGHRQCNGSERTDDNKQTIAAENGTEIAEENGGGQCRSSVEQEKKGATAAAVAATSHGPECAVDDNEFVAAENGIAIGKENGGQCGISVEGEKEAAAQQGECHGNESNVETMITRILVSGGAQDFLFRRVPPHYYDSPIEARREMLCADSIECLCKSIVMVNTQAEEHVRDCSNVLNSKYYVVVIQYAARLKEKKLKDFLYDLNKGKVSKKRFNMRLAQSDISQELTGFGHNAVTPFGMKTNIPVILSHEITNLNPPFFWLGGGEVDLKLGIRTDDFIRLVDPFIVDCTD